MPVYLLLNPIMKYDWGSVNALADLQQREPSGEPEAELWMGTHHRGSSAIFLGPGDTVPLGELAGELSFLFKVIAAEKALSIQVHPDLQQAAEGFDRENAAGTPLDADERMYRDRNHKPELMVALSDFWLLAGFRPLEELQAEMRGLPQYLTGAFVDHPGEESWRELFSRLITLEGDEVRRIVSIVKAAASGTAPRHDRYWWVRELSRQFPEDPGSIAPLYMNCLHLRKGEAMFLQPRTLHAYLKGSGVELMASSDNVLRAGCTTKHRDPQELMRILDFETGAPGVMHPDTPADGLERWSTPAAEFQLSRVRRGGRYTASGETAIVLNVGESVECDGEPFLTGDAFVITPDSGAVAIEGDKPMELYVATVPGAWNLAE